MISEIYSRNLDKDIVSAKIISNISLSSNVRFPIFVNDRTGLISYLKSQGIFVSDIWYDAPVAPSKLIDKTDYNGDCPVAEKISLEILNLPTHKNISMKEAEKISAYINAWQNINQI
jgi:dTDP-4-amino-4,6-dideoxygalactose transaminase